jgi:hypothetical protein
VALPDPNLDSAVKLPTDTVDPLRSHAKAGLTRTGPARVAFGRAAEHRGISAGPVALAWLLHRSPVIVPIPGAGKGAAIPSWPETVVSQNPTTGRVDLGAR